MSTSHDDAHINVAGAQGGMAERARPRVGRVPTWDVLELYGEMGLALWYAEHRRRSLGVFGIAVRHLVRVWDPEQPRCREVFHKTRYVLEWISSWATDDDPPLVEPPQPGWFVLPNKELRTLTIPLPLGILLYRLGQATAGLDMRHRALREINQACQLAQQRGMLWLRGMGHIDATILASSLGRFEQALTALVEAAKWAVAAHAIHDRGEDLLSTSIDPNEVWEGLAEMQKRQAQQTLLWLAVIPGVVRALTTDGDASVLEPWRARVHTPGLIDVPYLESVLDGAQAVLAPVGCYEVAARLRGIPAEDTTLRLVLGLALAESIGAPLDAAVRAHADVLVHLIVSRRTVSPALHDFCAYISSYWKRVAAEKSFQLRLPGPFRDRMLGVAARPDTTTTCRVLLWAEEAAGAQLPADLRARLTSKSAP